MVVSMNKGEMAPLYTRLDLLVEMELVTGGGTSPNRGWLQGAALQHSARLDRRLLSGDEWPAAAELS
jgi:hypothetical protein